MIESGPASELDLALIEAIQRQPRAPWARLADVLGTTPVTLARRWERLRQVGLARVVVTPGTEYDRVGITAFISLDCDPARLDAVADHASENPRIAVVQLIAGEPDLLLTAFAPDLATLRYDVLAPLQHTDGVRAVRLSLTTAIHTEGSRWHLGALDRDQSRQLSDEPAESPFFAPAQDGTFPKVLEALSHDGRASLTELSNAAGMSPTTFGRRLAKILNSGVIRLRCDVASPLFGWPFSATMWLRAPAPVDRHLARELVKQPPTRAVCSITGPANLIIQVVLQSIDQLPLIELDLLDRYPSITVLNTAVDLRTVKLMGWMLDDAGRGERLIPLVLW